jgi:aminopeptidase N
MIRYCADAYLAATALERDTAIADPAVYGTKAYRGIAFCKVPVVLDMLRSEAGDETFFAAWRKAFQEFDPKEDGYAILENAFSECSGTDLSWFFEQWFFRAGCPEIAAQFSQQEDAVTITLRQAQKQGPYRLAGELLITDKQDSRLRRKVTLKDRETKLTMDVPFSVHKVVFDPDNRLLKKTRANSGAEG